MHNIDFSLPLPQFRAALAQSDYDHLAVSRALERLVRAQADHKEFVAGSRLHATGQGRCAGSASQPLNTLDTLCQALGQNGDSRAPHRSINQTTQVKVTLR